MKGIKLWGYALGMSVMILSASSVQADSYKDYDYNYDEEDGEIAIVNPNDNLATIDGVLFNKVEKRLLKYPRENSTTSYSIPEGVTSIGEEAFYGCENLTNITIPEGVTSIGEDAFSECENLTILTTNDYVQEYAFKNKIDYKAPDDTSWLDD